MILLNDVTSRRKPDSSLGIYLAAAKLAQYRLVAKNRREKEENKNKRLKKTATQKLHFQQKQCEDFQKCQEYMNSLALSTTEELMFINLVNLSSNNPKVAF